MAIWKCCQKQRILVSKRTTRVVTHSKIKGPYDFSLKNISLKASRVSQPLKETFDRELRETFVFDFRHLFISYLFTTKYINMYVSTQQVSDPSCRIIHHTPSFCCNGTVNIKKLVSSKLFFKKFFSISQVTLQSLQYRVDLTFDRCFWCKERNNTDNRRTCMKGREVLKVPIYNYPISISHPSWYLQEHKD